MGIRKYFRCVFTIENVTFVPLEPKDMDKRSMCIYVQYCKVQHADTFQADVNSYFTFFSKGIFYLFFSIPAQKWACVASYPGTMYSIHCPKNNPTNAGRTFLSPIFVKFGFVINSRKINILYFDENCYIVILS